MNSSIVERRARPAPGRAEAFERFAALRRADDARILPGAVSRFYAHEERSRIAVVLLHGFTNNPAQFDRLAPALHARGHSVIVPRLPGHGDRDRRGLRLRGVRAEAWLATTHEAIDIAAGVGSRVVVAGVSLGGALAAWTAVRRRDVDRAVAISPFLGVMRLMRLANVAVERLLTLAPNVVVPWDPFGDGALIPPSAYPAFPTRGLAESLRVGLEVVAGAHRFAPACGDLILLTNARDPAVQNRLAEVSVRAWNARRPGSAGEYRFTDLPANHDIVDPTNPMQRIDVVYPKVIEAIEGTGWTGIAEPRGTRRL